MLIYYHQLFVLQNKIHNWFNQKFLDTYKKKHEKFKLHFFNKYKSKKNTKKNMFTKRIIINCDIVGMYPRIMKIQFYLSNYICVLQKLREVSHIHIDIILSLSLSCKQLPTNQLSNLPAVCCAPRAHIRVFD